MKKNVLLLVLCTSGFLHLFRSGQAQEFQVNQANSSAGKRSSAYTMQNKIVSVKRASDIFTYFGYYLAGTTVDNAYILEYNNTNGNKNYVFVGTMVDNIESDYNHGSPVLAVDTQGRLHTLFGAHYSNLKYRKSYDPVFTNNLNFGSNTVVNIPTLKLTNSTEKDDWTYPILKVDDSNVLHVGGSLDAEHTDIDFDNLDENLSREFGYIRNINNTSNSPWTFPLLSDDPVNLYRAPYGLCRYNPMMNIDKDNVIHVLAASHVSDTAAADYGRLDYYYFTKSPAQNKFISNGQAYFNDGQLYEEGVGNIEFDHLNRPHFLVVKGSFRTNYDVNEEIGYERWLIHRFYNGTSWETEEIRLSGGRAVIQNATLRIDRDGEMYILLQRSHYSNEGASASQIALLSKSARYPAREWRVNGLTPENTILFAQPSIEQDNRSNLTKNWFYTMWQGANSSSEFPTITAKKIVPCEAFIQNRTFSNHVDYVAGQQITIGENVTSGATGNVVFTSGSNTSIVTAGSIKFTKGFKVESGALFSAKRASNIACIETVATGGGGGGQSKIYDHAQNDHFYGQEKAFRIYPNPSSGKFTLKAVVNGPTKLVIYNLLSQIVHQETFEGNGSVDRTLNIPNKGVYVVEVRSSSKRFVERVIVH